MYTGFNFYNYGSNFKDCYKQQGEILYADQKKLVHSKLTDFISMNNTLNASKIQANWFPTVQAEVFISHSHRDAQLAISLAGWLYNSFNINAFVDSCVWGYSDDLLKLIDDEYCYNQRTATYQYEKRNRSTSHVHMMLSVALLKMLDACECIIFLNTPASILPSDTIQDSGASATLSAWIYSEIEMTRLIQKRKRESYRNIKVANQLNIKEDLNFSYDINTNHLITLNLDDIKRWKKNTKHHIQFMHLTFSMRLRG
jgi:hypothetical protein